jgi:hypothetical protein
LLAAVLPPAVAAMQAISSEEPAAAGTVKEWSV